MAHHIIAVIASYLLGGIPIGLLVGKSRGLDDIRKYGSGNIGASNVLRVIGVKAGIFVWVMDAVKGFAPAAICAHLLGVTGWWLVAVALAAIVGHCFSPYLRLTGGRGVSTSLGVVLALDWRAGLVCFGLWIVIVALTRYISLGSMVSSLLAGPVLWLYGREAAYVTAGGLLGALITVRHIPNIGRLLAGTESRIGQRVKGQPEPGSEEAQ